MAQIPPGEALAIALAGSLDTPREMIGSLGRAPLALLVLAAALWLPPFLLALPAGLAARRALRRAFGGAALALVAWLLVFMLPVSSQHTCDGDGTDIWVLPLFLPFIAGALALFARLVAAFTGRARTAEPR